MPGSIALTNAVGELALTPVDAQPLTSAPQFGNYLYNGTTLDLSRSVSGDAMAATGIRAEVPMRFNGATYDRSRIANVFKIVTTQAVTAATGFTAWSVTGGKKFRLIGYCLSTTNAAAIRFYEGLTTALTTERFKSPILAAAGTDSRDVIGGNGLLASAVNMNLNIDVSATTNLTGCVWGTEE